MTTTTLPTKEALADYFVATLKDWLTPEEWSAMRKRNRLYGDGSKSCASHEFCDANMAMHEAFVACGCDPEKQWGGDYAASDEFTVLWGAAWEHAMPRLTANG